MSKEIRLPSYWRTAAFRTGLSLEQSEVPSSIKKWRQFCSQYGETNYEIFQQFQNEYQNYLEDQNPQQFFNILSFDSWVTEKLSIKTPFPVTEEVLQS